MNVTQKDKNDINELSVSRNIATQVMCVCVCMCVYLGLMSLSTIFQSYHDGVWL